MFHNLSYAIFTYLGLWRPALKMQPLIEEKEMQRILSVYDWQVLPAGSEVNFKSDLSEQRLVRLRVNAPSPAALYVKLPDVVDPIFLARVVGLDEVQFNVAGPFTLMAYEGDCWFDTLDGARADVEAVEPDSFTSIVERKARNYELELIERKMQENIERRMSALMGDMSSRLAAKDLEIEAARTAAAAASTPASEPAGGQVPPAEPVEPPAGGTSGAGEANAG